ncbi:Helix-turn-helix [Terribacillus halophilus]|uniref:Helix-turn-helix n=1 Tax=Terribacillus halophilus TaxID=361279 RepID=A0A1G6INJ3_9BACI|nr:helix-turn-helix transcriptional regulator [Terribacillus halophilus]SDC08034.1 Helix-turn-helix [Terribacillus halophilus]
MNLGEKLKHFREQKNMSREELAQKMNVSRQAVYKWETNKGYPDIDNLIQLSNLFEITIDELIKGDSLFQKKITIDDQKKSKDHFSDPGFYLGILLLVIGGIFLEDGALADALTILGLLTIVFYDDFKKLFWGIIRDFKEEKYK